MTSVLVAVRVRPFTEREIQLKSKLCISMNNNSTTIQNLDGDQKSHTFAFDFSYWSHDGYFTDKTGYFWPVDPKYIDQIKVHEDIGKSVVENAWNGYNATLFAYGQTGSGKSYTIVGYESNLGIIGRVCADIFQRIECNTDQLIQYEISVSMLEIYNEQVHDLLINPSERTSGGLKIRKSPEGVFVAGLTRHTVDSYEAIHAKLEKGTNSRTIGATQMNASSSRAHTVFTVFFKQIKYDGVTQRRVSQKTSDINLVDLAGSERIDTSNTSQSSLKEGANINKSLSVLGKVISILAEKESGGADSNAIPPYRDSALTKILQNALGGNSKTAMVASLSPASINYQETLSTLRFASRVKSIKTNASVNENAVDKLVREMKDEIERLKQLIVANAEKNSGIEGLATRALSIEQQQLAKNKNNLDEMMAKWTDKSMKHGSRNRMSVELHALQERSAPTQPCIKNINADPFLSGKLVFQIPMGTCTIGRNDPQDPPDIVVGGAGIMKQHAKFTVSRSISDSDVPGKFRCFIEVKAKVTINGELLKTLEVKELVHKDRILLGNHNLFVYHDPDESDKTLPEWDDVMKEASKNYLKQFKNNINSIQGRRASFVSADQQAMTDWETHNKLLQEAITRTIVLLEEANMIAEEMGTPVFFSFKLVTAATTAADVVQSQWKMNSEGVADDPFPKAELNICVHRLDSAKVQFWPLDVFETQVFEIRELYAKWSQEPESVEVQRQNDVFWNVENSYHLIGNAYVFLEHLRNLISFEDDKLPILDFKGKKVGTLRLSIEVTLESTKHQRLLDATQDHNDPFVEGNGIEILENYFTVSELIGRTLHFKLFIEEAAIFANESYSETQVSYKWIDRVSEFKASSHHQENKNPKFMHINNFSVDISHTTVEWFNGALIFEIIAMTSDTSPQVYTT